MVAGLKEGGLYRFRVRAVNAAGVGDPGLVSELIEVKDRTSKTLVHPTFECGQEVVFLLIKLYERSIQTPLKTVTFLSSSS